MWRQHFAALTDEEWKSRTERLLAIDRGLHGYTIMTGDDLRGVAALAEVSRDVQRIIVASSAIVERARSHDPSLADYVYFYQVEQRVIFEVFSVLQSLSVRGANPVDLTILDPSARLLAFLAGFLEARVLMGSRSVAHALSAAIGRVRHNAEQTPIEFARLHHAVVPAFYSTAFGATPERSPNWNTAVSTALSDIERAILRR